MVFTRQHTIQAVPLEGTTCTPSLGSRTVSLESRTVDAFSVLGSCGRRFSPSTSLILSIGCSPAYGPSNCPFDYLGTLAPAVTQLHSMNCRKETAAICRVIRSN